MSASQSIPGHGGSSTRATLAPIMPPPEWPTTVRSFGSPPNSDVVRRISRRAQITASDWSLNGSSPSSSGKPATWSITGHDGKYTSARERPRLLRADSSSYGSPLVPWSITTTGAASVLSGGRWTSASLPASSIVCGDAGSIVCGDAGSVVDVCSEEAPPSGDPHPASPIITAASIGARRFTTIRPSDGTIGFASVLGHSFAGELSLGRSAHTCSRNREVGVAPTRCERVVVCPTETRVSSSVS